MATPATAASTGTFLKKLKVKAAPKSGRAKSSPVPASTTAAPALVIAASKPRNPIAVDALLKKSGPHADKRHAKRLRAQEQLRSGLDEVRKQIADD